MWQYDRDRELTTDTEKINIYFRFPPSNKFLTRQATTFMFCEQCSVSVQCGSISNAKQHPHLEFKKRKASTTACIVVFCCCH